MRIMALTLILVLAVSCGIETEERAGNTQSLKTEKQMLFVARNRPVGNGYCVLWKAEDKTRLLTTSGGVTKEQLKALFITLTPQDESFFLVLVPILGFLPWVFSQKFLDDFRIPRIITSIPLVVWVGSVAAGSGTVIYYRIKRGKMVKALTAKRSSDVSSRDMDRAIRRVSGLKSGSPGSCDYLVAK